MARISIRIFVDDAEHDRIDDDLPPDSVPELVETCRQAVEDRKPLSAEEAAEAAEEGRRLAELLANRGKGALEERMRREESLAEQMLKARGWRVEKPD